MARPCLAYSPAQWSSSSVCHKRLQSAPDFSARGLILRSHVEMAGTTDDPCDSLEWHRKLASDTDFPVRVYPTFRPDRALQIHQSGFKDYIRRLERAAGYPLATVEDVKRALKRLSLGLRL
mgnify:CR=1 FL=1